MSGTNNGEGGTPVRLAPQDEWVVLHLIRFALENCELYMNAEDMRQAALFLREKPKAHPLADCVRKAASGVEELIAVLKPLLPPGGDPGDLGLGGVKPPPDIKVVPS